MALIAQIKENRVSGYSKRDSDGLTVFLNGGKYGDGDIHFTVKLHFTQKQLAALLTEQFYYPEIMIEVSDDALIITA